MAKFKLRGPDGGTYAITADTPEAAHAALYGTQAEAAPKSDEPVPQDNKQQTEDLPIATKALKALAFSAENLMKGDAKTASYAGAKDLASHMYRNAQNAHEMGGLDNYDPASPHFADSSKPWTERIGYAPRALLEGAAPMVQHGLGFIAGGPAGAAASVGAAELGNTIDEVNAADKTDPNTTPSVQQAARILGKVGVDAGLTVAGGGATLGAKASLPKAAITDAIVGAGSVTADKGLIHGELPTKEDVALNAGVGGLTGAVIRLPSAAREGAGQVHQSIIDKRLEPLETASPTSLARAAKLIEENQRGIEGAQEKLHLSLNEQRGHRDFTSQIRSIEEAAAAKGQKDTIKEDLRLLHDDLSKGDVVSPDAIQKIASRISGTHEGDRIVQSLTDMNTLNHMNQLDTGGLSASPLGMALNPFQRDRTSTPATRAGAALGRLAEGATIGHSLWSGKPSALLAIAGQFGGSQVLKGIDKLSGAADFEKSVVKKYAGGDTGPGIDSKPFQTIRGEQQAKQDLQNEFRKAADLDVTNKELQQAKLEKKILDFRRIAARDAKLTQKLKDKEIDSRISKFQKQTDGKLKLLDALEAEDRSKAAAAEKSFWDKQREQKDIMVRSQADEERRVASEAKAFASLLKQQKAGLDVRERSESASSTNAGLALRLSNLKEKYRKKAEADAKKDELAVAKSIGRNNKKTQSAMTKLKKSENVEALAKASKRVKEAEAAVEQNLNTPRPEVHTIRVHGVEITQPKTKIGDYDGWVNGTYERMDARKAFIDEAKAAMPKQNKQLSGLFKTWAKQGSKLSDAQKSFDRLKSKLSQDEQQKLQSLWNTHDIAWTWKDDD